MRTRLVISLAVCCALHAPAQQNPEIQTIPVQGNIYLLTGAGGNITVQVGDQGVLLVDTATRYYDSLTNDSAGNEALQWELAQSYSQLARLQAGHLAGQSP